MPYVVTDGVRTLSENATVNGAAGSISLFFILFAVIFGVSQHKLKLTGWKEVVFGLVCTVLAFVFGMNFPVILGKEMWGIYRIPLHLSGGSASDVVCHAAKRLHVHLYVYRNDRRSGAGAWCLLIRP